MSKNPADEADHSEANERNQALVDQLKSQGLLRSPHVEMAFRSVLRDLFLPGTPLAEVYSDRAISAKQNEPGRWISSSSQPAIMAIMLEQLDVQPGHKVLEIGTGPGYNAALLAHIVGDLGQVVTVEIDQDLADTAREHLTQAGFGHVQVICADGGYGYPDAAPYDRIILTVGAPDITPGWWNQLKPDGRLVLPLLLRGSMKSIAFARMNDHLSSISASDCGFIPLRGDFASAFPKRIQVGSAPGLYLEPMHEFAIDGDATYDMLTGPHRDLPANLDVQVWDVLNGSLWTWLALHEPHMCKLIAEGAMVERDIVPHLIGIAAKQNSSITAILLGTSGASAFMRPPEEPLPLIPADKLFVPDSPAALPFPLFIRQFGSDDSITRRLLTQIERWKALGAPSSNTMQIRAYRKDSDYKPAGEEIVLEKQWTKVIIAWH